MRNKIIEQAEKFAKETLVGEGTGHDWWHVVRVVNIAKKIHEQEGGDWLIINLALLLHDVGDRKVINQENDDYTIAENFLETLDLGEAVVEKIMSIIQTMSFSKSFDNAQKDDSLEFKIVQDADRLDAIGAIGIARHLHMVAVVLDSCTILNVPRKNSNRVKIIKNLRARPSTISTKSCFC